MSMQSIHSKPWKPQDEPLTFFNKTFSRKKIGCGGGKA